MIKRLFCCTIMLQWIRTLVHSCTAGSLSFYREALVSHKTNTTGHTVLYILNAFYGMLTF